MSPLHEITQDAARLICEELLFDYHSAKLKAAQRLGYGSKVALPDNARVQQAVIEYQQLFGGAAYREHLQCLRRVALQAMKLLAPFQPRLVGGAVSGAVHAAHRVQLHAFCEKPEAIEIFLLDCGIRGEQHDRDYRYSRHEIVTVPLTCFDTDEAGVDVAGFGLDEQRRAPLNPADGAPYRRLDTGAVQALLSEG